MCSKRPEREAVAAVHSIGMPSVPARSLSREEEEEATLSLPLSLSLSSLWGFVRAPWSALFLFGVRERERESAMCLLYGV